MLQQAQTAADGLIKDTTTQTFVKDVIEESKRQPVLIDFWAPWCGPCKQLAPMLEKAVAASGGKVKLVKMNIDEHPQIAGQLGIQSIPAVIAYNQFTASLREFGARLDDFSRELLNSLEEISPKQEAVEREAASGLHR